MDINILPDVIYTEIPGLKIVKEKTDGRMILYPLVNGEYIRRDLPGSPRIAVKYMGHEAHPCRALENAFAENNMRVPRTFWNMFHTYDVRRVASSYKSNGFTIDYLKGTLHITTLGGMPENELETGIIEHITDIYYNG